MWNDIRFWLAKELVSFSIGMGLLLAGVIVILIFERKK
jgi:hypothetical protein